MLQETTPLVSKSLLLIIIMFWLQIKIHELPARILVLRICDLHDAPWNWNHCPSTQRRNKRAGSIHRSKANPCPVPKHRSPRFVVSPRAPRAFHATGRQTTR
jgi:hypothetical protein